MTSQNGCLISRLLLAPLSVSLVLLPVGVTPAQNTSSGTVIFRPNGSPSTTSGGSSRGICSTGIAAKEMPYSAIVPLIPATDVELTAEDRPTIFVQITDSTFKEVELSVWDDRQNGIYQTTIPLPGKAGIVSVKLPEDAPALKVGTRYKWTLAVICDPSQRSRDAVVQGWIERIELSIALKEKLSTPDILERAKLYAENQIWYETVATLAQLRRSHPEDVKVTFEWQQLLESVGLKDVTQAPLVNCCQSPN
ncbi:MAG TPA: DUF928 domain-containing protein [Leptolyngbyaceae cyanobacterium]